MAARQLRWHEIRRRRKSEGGQKFLVDTHSPTPFLFARPSLKVFQNSAFGFSLKKVRISFSVRSQQKNTDLNQYFFVCSDFTPKLELNSKKGFKLFYKKLLKAPAPAFKSNNFPAGKARL